MTTDEPWRDTYPLVQSGTQNAEPPIETVPRLCGCAGKTPLDRVVYPARRQISARLAETRVRLAGTLDAALIPRRTTLDSDVETHAFGGGDAHQSPRPTERPTGTRNEAPIEWALGSTFVTDDLATVDTFVEHVGAAYERLGVASAGHRGQQTSAKTPRTVVGKAHSVQIPGATTGIQWFERLQPGGSRRPGYWAGNVDVVHAFPGLAPRRQAAVAVAHALNDCYAVGGTEERRIRPVVAVPSGTHLEPETVAAWYADSMPAVAELDDPSVVRHDGRGWLFGASVTAAVTRRPPLRVSAVEPGDDVLLHRPLGALAAYSLAVDSTIPDAVYERVVDTLTRDHVDVARVLSSFSPALGEPFDPERHVKLVTDVSGPGLAGIARLLAPSGTLHLTDLPLLDEDVLSRARERWVTPDVTVETNGPLAVVARPGVVDAVTERLASEAGADPARLGTVRPSTTGRDESSRSTAPVDAVSAGTGPTVSVDELPVTTGPNVELARYIERYLRGSLR